jgi:hypothetical protein
MLDQQSRRYLLFDRLLVARNGGDEGYLQLLQQLAPVGAG